MDLGYTKSAFNFNICFELRRYVNSYPGDGRYSFRKFYVNDKRDTVLIDDQAGKPFAITIEAARQRFAKYLKDGWIRA